ncbi:MAG: Crp/Fnr family transcriptional regulator [Saprospiraceae bacterium]|nr:Crp/Fnr family transcriptional regulator [Saprospiraceae bacterium]MBP6566333.1 Crp/Fnr family transcriptional regulator [Saprospiraceae bacterium]
MELFDFFDSIYKISEDAKTSLDLIINEKTFDKNDIIQDIGSRCRTVYIVKKGGARIFYYKNGIDITEHFAFENDIIVRAESLFTGKPTLKGIQAIDRTTMFAIDAQNLFELYDRHHELERLFRLIFEKEYVNTVKRLESLQFNSAKERYLDLLEKTDFVQKIPLKYIASYLGITQVSLSRIRAGAS